MLSLFFFCLIVCVGGGGIKEPRVKESGDDLVSAFTFFTGALNGVGGFLGCFLGGGLSEEGDEVGKVNFGFVNGAHDGKGKGLLLGGFLWVKVVEGGVVKGDVKGVVKGAVKEIGLAVAGHGVVFDASGEGRGREFARVYFDVEILIDEGEFFVANFRVGEEGGDEIVGGDGDSVCGKGEVAFNVWEGIVGERTVKVVDVEIDVALGDAGIGEERVDGFEGGIEEVLCEGEVFEEKGVVGEGEDGGTSGEIDLWIEVDVALVDRNFATAREEGVAEGKGTFAMGDIKAGEGETVKGNSGFALAIVENAFESHGEGCGELEGACFVARDSEAPGMVLGDGGELVELVEMEGEIAREVEVLLRGEGAFSLKGKVGGGGFEVGELEGVGGGLELGVEGGGAGDGEGVALLIGKVWRGGDVELGLEGFLDGEVEAIVDLPFKGEGGILAPLTPLGERDFGDDVALAREGECCGGGVPVEHTRGIEG